MLSRNSFDVSLVLWEQINPIAIAHVCEGRDLLQFSPTGSDSTEGLVYAGCLSSTAKKAPETECF